VVMTSSGPRTKEQAVVIDVATMTKTASITPPGPAYTGQGRWYGAPAWIDDQHIVVGSPSGRLVVWKPATGDVVMRLNDPPASDTGDAAAVRVTPNGSEVVVAGFDTSAVMAYDLRTGARRWPRATVANGDLVLDSVSNVVWAQEAGVGSSRLFAYDLATGNRIAGELNTQHGTACDARTSPDAKIVALASCNEGTIAVWSLDGTTATGPSLQPAGWSSSSDLWSPDGRFVATFKTDTPDEVEVVDIRRGKRLRASGVTASQVNTPIFRSDDVLQAVVDRTNHIVEFNAKTGQTRDSGVVLPNGAVSANVAVRDGLSIYGMDDGTVFIVDVAHAKIVQTLATGLIAVFGVQWSSDGHRVFAAGQKEEVRVYDVASGEKVAALATPAATLAIDTDHKLIATAAFNGTINFYDAVTLQPTGDPLTGGAAFAAQLQFTPDGRTLITSGLDSTMRLFDVASRRQVGVPIPIASWGAAIAPDSKEIAISTDRGVQRLALDPVALRTAACRAAGRNLTRVEWAQYIGGTPRRLCPEWPSALRADPDDGR
nr:PQQ-binding-like beta-propeller repeat protein [Actinomycetota bacterium]